NRSLGHLQVVAVMVNGQSRDVEGQVIPAVVALGLFDGLSDLLTRVSDLVLVLVTLVTGQGQELALLPAEQLVTVSGLNVPNQLVELSHLAIDLLLLRRGERVVGGGFDLFVLLLRERVAQDREDVDVVHGNPLKRRVEGNPVPAVRGRGRLLRRRSTAPVTGTAVRTVVGRSEVVTGLDTPLGGSLVLSGLDKAEASEEPLPDLPVFDTELARVVLNRRVFETRRGFSVLQVGEKCFLNLLGCELPGTEVLVEPVQVLFPVLGLVAGLLGKRSPVLQEPVNARVIQNPTDRLLELFERTEGDGVAGLRLSIGEPGPDQGQEGGEDLLPVLLGEPDEVGVVELVVVAQVRVRSLRTEVDRVNAALKVAL